MNSDSRGFNLTVRAGPLPVGTERSGVPRLEREMLDAAWADWAAEMSRLALALGLSTHQAEDAVQDVYIQALRNCPAGLSRTELRRWLFRVATNRCLLEHRRRKRWTSVVERLKKGWRSGNGQTTGTVVSEVEATTCDDERRRVVRMGLDTLDPELRSVLVLRYFAGFNSKEIGRLLDTPDSTVRSRLRQARTRLAQALEGTGYDET